MGSLSAAEVMESLTPEQFDKIRARHEVIPFDHCEKMLGIIALMLAQYLGHKGNIEALCCPWTEEV